MPEMVRGSEPEGVEVHELRARVHHGLDTVAHGEVPEVRLRACVQNR